MSDCEQSGEGKKEEYECTEVSVYVEYILSTVETDNTYTEPIILPVVKVTDVREWALHKTQVFADTLKACALIGLHLLAADGECGSSGSQSPNFGDMRRYGCPESPDWDIESWTESEGTCSSERCGHNVDCLALNVMGVRPAG